MRELAGRIALAIGVFDGVHRGHRAVAQKLLACAQESAAKPVALFFDPLPRQVIHPEIPVRLLTPPAEKCRLLHELGIQIVVKRAFTAEFAAMTPEHFANKELLGNPGVTITDICVGDDWRFGAQNAGDAALLRRLLAPSGVRVHEVAGVEIAGGRVSSSRIRAAIATGELGVAKELLGRPYALVGEVVHGNAIARRSFGCPTANLFSPEQQLPPYGVYAARARLSDEPGEFCGIVYVGEAPTIRGDGNGVPTVELHLFEFQENLYGRRLAVEPVRFLRESRKFPSVEALSEQIHHDIQEAEIALKESRDK